MFSIEFSHQHWKKREGIGTTGMAIQFVSNRISDKKLQHIQHLLNLFLASSLLMPQNSMVISNTISSFGRGQPLE